MRIHRGHLFWGVFFVLLGAIPLADRLGWIDAADLREVWRLWPLAIIAVGVAILVSRTRLALVGSVMAAVVLGGVAGGALAYGGGWIFGLGGCAPGGDMQRAAERGAFSADASVLLELSCGSLAAQVVAGHEWSLDAAYRDDPPDVQAGDDRLSVTAPSGAGRQEWSVDLPAERLRELSVTTNAGEAQLDLDGVELEALAIQSNAGSVRLSADESSIADLDVRANAGSVTLALDGDVVGSLNVNAGSIDLCVPDDAALAFDLEEQLAFATNLGDEDLERDGDTWRRDGAGATIQLRIEGNAASFNLNPSGGCQ